MRYKARRDSNDSAITDAVRVAGFTVIDFGRAGQGIPDKLVTRPLPDGKPFACWMEVKAEGGKLRPGQEAFRAIFEPRGEWIEARDPGKTVSALLQLYMTAIPQEQLR